MKINLVLAPEQLPAQLLAFQTANSAHFFYLGKETQLSGANVLIVDEPELVAQFKRPLSFDSRVVSGNLAGEVIHQISFQTKGRNDELIEQLVTGNAIMAQNANGKADFMLWTFWPDHQALANFVNSDTFKQMKNLMKNAYTVSYFHISSADQLSLTHQMRDVDDTTWWG